MPDKNNDADILRHTTPPRLKATGIIALVVALVIVVAGVAWRLYGSYRTAAWTDDQAVQAVQLVQLKSSGSGQDLTLPGDIEAFTNAPIYAQISGYVQKWFVDIGGKVKSGDLLAQIDPRPYQAALDQAKGQLAKDQATLAGAQIDLKRYQALMAANAEAQQTVDDQAALVATDAGIVETDKAAVETANINLEYTRIIAPFDGIVTSRTIDVGTLVVVGTASAMPLFTVTDQTKLRIYVHVPQIDMALIKPGMTVQLTVPEYPGRTFIATLAASADAVTSASGTQLIQFQTDNADGALKPGDYAEVHFALPLGQGVIRVPATALLFRDQGMMVATVDGAGRVALKPVRIRTDLGTAVEVDSGLSPNDRVIDNPPDSIRQGDAVKIARAGRAPAGD